MKSLSVAGYKSVRDATIDFGPLNVLLGANGAGKSNLLSVFELLGALADDRLALYARERGGPDALLHNGSKFTSQLRFGVELERQRYSVEISFDDDGAAFVGRESLAQRAGSGDFRVINDFFTQGGGQRPVLIFEAPAVPAAKSVLDALRSLRVYHFHDTSRTAAVRREGQLDDNQFLRADASNLAAWLYLLRSTAPESYERIVAAIRQVAPFFRDFDLRPDPLNTARIRLEWRERDSDAYCPPSRLSDGTLRFVCLAALLLQPKPPALLVIDEPELGLHPYAITQLAALLRAAAHKTRLVVATHSTTLVNQFEPEHLVIVDRVDGASTFRRPTSVEIATWLDGYSLGELWEKNVLGGRPSAT